MQMQVHCKRMGISIELTSSLKVKDKAIPIEPAKIAQRMVQWAMDRYPSGLLDAGTQPHETGCLAWFNFHDAGDPVTIDIQQSGTLVASADTTSVGPGYHAHICDFFIEIGREYKIQWPKAAGDDGTDDTEYFFTGDQQALEAAFTGWVGGVCRMLMQNEREEWVGIAIKLPIDCSYLAPGDILTSSGPRSREWVSRVAAFPRQGHDLFPWWERRWSAKHDLDLALCNMHLHIKWAPPASDEDAQRVHRVLRSLREAYLRDPSLAFPWAEWAELLDIAEFAEMDEEDPKLAALVRKNAEGKVAHIGYRRHDVVYRDLPGGWHITVPGSMSLTFEDDGGTWMAFDESRSIRFSSMSITPGPGVPPPSIEDMKQDPPRGASPRIEWTDGDAAGAGFITQEEEEGHRYHALSGTTCCDWQIGFSTICFDSIEDRDWALRVWKSARVAGARASNA